MWSGLEPDTELFASGRVLDDDGEWAGAQALDSSSGISVTIITLLAAWVHASM